MSVIVTDLHMGPGSRIPTTRSGVPSGERAYPGSFSNHIEAWADQQQPSTPEHTTSLLLRLPKKLLHPIARHYRPTIAGALVSPEVKSQRKTEKTPRREVPAPSERDFWLRVAKDERIKEVALNGEWRVAQCLSEVFSGV